MNGKIDLEYRPASYFGPRPLERYLISKVKNAVLRKRLESMAEAGQHAEIEALLGAAGVSTADLKALESIHPMFMGGNYLPDAADGEIEIGRISIRSVTGDVTCVYARPDGNRIRYRVVDEYEGQTLEGDSETLTDKPMTLREFADFFLSAWPLLDVLEMNFEGDREESLDFFTAASDYYPDFDRLCRERVMERFPEKELREDE